MRGLRSERMARKTGGSEPGKGDGSSIVEVDEGDVRIVVELRGVHDLPEDVVETLQDEMLQAVWEGVLQERGILHAELRA